jgi:hypothetical protein
MSDVPTLKDEYQMLIGEIRQNRQIQLQTFSTTPIWISLFFGLVSSGSNEALKTTPALSLIPIPLLFISLLLIVDRRHSSDVIIAYFRTAIDEKLASGPGWNYLLPEFRRNLERLSKSKRKPKQPATFIPQRFDFNVVVWLSYISLALICNALYYVLAPTNLVFFIISLSSTIVAFLLVLYWLFRQSSQKRDLVEAWKKTLTERRSSDVANPGT